MAYNLSVFAKTECLASGGNTSAHTTVTTADVRRAANQLSGAQHTTEPAYKVQGTEVWDTESKAKRAILIDDIIHGRFMPPAKANASLTPEIRTPEEEAMELVAEQTEFRKAAQESPSHRDNARELALVNAR